MKYISHRGNTTGRLEFHENEPNYIDLAIKKGYDVEVDVWYKNHMLWLGHDKPDYGIHYGWFRDRITNLWIHCKSIETLQYFNEEKLDHFNYFYHTDEDVVLTSKKYMWGYPGRQMIKGGIAVLPELYNDDVTQCIGICSDYIEEYKEGLR